MKAPPIRPEGPEDQAVHLYPNSDGTTAGYVRFIESWGSDARVVESARMSTDGAFRGWGTPEKPGDEKLLKYLHDNHHATPFEFAGLIIEMQVPLFVLRQIQRHRAAGYNEESGRYRELDSEFWLPRPEDIRKGGGSNRQGSVVDESEMWQQVSADAIDVMNRTYQTCFDAYEHLLKVGVCKEQARAVLPLALMVKCRMVTNLRMWVHFLGLRLDPHAQEETRVVAQVIAGLLEREFPRTMALFYG